MKNILCYGDSNTWGYNPYDGTRYDDDTRWTCLLQKKLGDNYKIIEAGLNGRTTSFDTQISDIQNGRKFINYEINSHKPIDILIIMLGTNDLKHSYNLFPENIARGIESLIIEAKKCIFEGNNKNMGIIIISPPKVTEKEVFSPMFKDAEEKCIELPRCFKEKADLYKCYFINATEEINSCDYDGIHLDKEGHKEMAELIFRRIKDIIKMSK